MKTLLSLAAVLLLTSACGETVPSGGAPWKETDKHLNCQQLQLEMNDAQFWNQVAHSKESMGVSDFLWPPGYIGRRASAQDAIGTTNARLTNLRNIYGIKGCNNPYPNMNVPPAY